MSDGAAVLECLAPLRSRVAIEQVLEVKPVRLRTLPGFEAETFAFTTDSPRSLATASWTV